MGDELVLALLELLDQVGIALGRQRVHRHAGPDLVAVEHVQHAEDAGPVAVLALRPDAVVGHVAAELADKRGSLWLPSSGSSSQYSRCSSTKEATRALRGQLSLGRSGKGA